MPLLALAFALALAQSPPCDPAWIPTFGEYPGATASVHVLRELHVGGANALYAGGAFTAIGNTPAHRVARFDGAAWTAIGAPNVAVVRALTVHGGELFAGGGITASSQPWVGRWDGNSWNTLGAFGATGQIYALASFDDGSGGALYAAGALNIVGIPGTTGIARWNGTAWSPVGQGLASIVYALAVHDDGSGRALYAGGSFTTAQGAPANHIARWNGAAWSGVGGALAPVASGVAVHALAVGDVGAGRELVAGGAFGSTAGVPNPGVVKWDGSAWQPVGPSAPGHVRAIEFAPLSNGTFLHVCESWGPAGPKTWHFDGNAWTSGSGAKGTEIATIAAFGGTLFKGGTFTSTGSSSAVNLARWNGSAWEALFQGANGTVYDVVAWDDGSGPALYVGGDFTTPGGGVDAPSLARWKAGSWTKIADFLGPSLSVQSLVVHDDGSGPSLFAAGRFLNGSAGNIARFDGTSWHPLGNGLYSHVGNGAWCMLPFDDGAGPSLFVGGGFEVAGSVPAKGIARWDGQSWHALQPNLEFYVRSMTTFDDGGGPKLYATDSTKIGRWNGGSFTWLPTLPSFVRDIATYGSGPSARLVAASTQVFGWSGLPGAQFQPLGVGGDGPKDVRVLLRTAQFGQDILVAAGTYEGKLTLRRFDGATWAPFGNGAEFGGGSQNPFTIDGPLNVLWAGDLLGKSALIAGGNYMANSHSGDGRLSIWTCPQPGAFVGVPGCAVNPAKLTGQGTLALGQSFGFEIASPTVDRGLALVFAGARALDPLGCGLFVAGLGEIVLAPDPLLVAADTIRSHAASFALTGPASPALVGVDVTFQAAAIATAQPGPPVALTNAVRASIGP